MLALPRAETTKPLSRGLGAHGSAEWDRPGLQQLCVWLAGRRMASREMYGWRSEEQLTQVHLSGQCTLSLASLPGGTC